MSITTPQTPKNRGSGPGMDQLSSSSLSPFEEDDLASKACFDILFAGPTPRMNLPDWLWRHESDVVRAIGRGHTGLEIWTLFKEKMPRFAFSYRSFARALADFRRAKGLPPAHGARKSAVAAAPKPVLSTAVSTSGEAKLPVPPLHVPPQAPAKNVPPVAREDQSEETPSAASAAPAAAAKIRAFLKASFKLPHELPPPGIIEEGRIADLLMREARISGNMSSDAG